MRDIFALYGTVWNWGAICLVLLIPLVYVLTAVARRQLGRRWLIAPALLAVVLVACIPQIGRALDDVHQREAIAHGLGVDIAPWGWPHNFPANYFAAVLQRGEERTDVHTWVRMYQRVDRCGPDANGYTQEIYYFHSTRAATAVRMEVQYGPSGKVYRVAIEDPESKPIITRGPCADGLWPD
jgi:hypothetical protein